MKRRGFLQRAGSILAALGLSETGLWLLADRAQAALAQPAGRKLALLVGIDRYPETIYGSNGFPLTGCVTDVQLQRELLIHRFGFQPDDILTLTDEQATRSQIETAFIAHLTDGAQADDVVVFHFSGYGSRIPLSESAQSWENTLVPVDGGLLDRSSATANHLPLETLWLMLRSLPTDRVLTVLDTSYVDRSRSLQGNFRIRSLPDSSVRSIGASALEFQAQLRRNSHFLSRFTPPRKVPGIVLGAASPQGSAMEAQWQGFSAGLFTYALTQHLWQTTDNTPFSATWQHAVETMQQWVGNAQQPQLCRGMALPCPVDTPNRGNSGNVSLPIEIDPTAMGSDGGILAIDPSDRMVRIWLAGLPAEIVESYGARSSLLSVVPVGTAEASPSTLLQVRTREGLMVKAQIFKSSDIAPLQAGQLVWEAVRVIPRHPNLIVALDETLERIERVDATSAFAALRHVSPVTVGEQPADCLFGRVRVAAPSADSPALTAPATGEDRSRYGLMSPVRELIPGSLTDTEEAVKMAIERLSPQLEKLRGAKLLRSIANEGSSRLGIQATLVVTESTEPVFLEKQTARGGSKIPQESLRESEKPKSAPNGSNSALTLPALSHIRYQVKNLGDRPIYFLIVSYDPDGRMSIYYPFAPDTEGHHHAVSAGEIMIVPSPSGSEGWQIGRMTGRVLAEIVCSTGPFTATLAALEVAGVPKSNSLETISSPIDIVSAIVEDLHLASLPATQNLGLSKEVFALDANNWATLSFLYEVV
ncbi:MAG: caspase family protein [Geitlerinemataceae cyanobacterium]